jgi:hypothetical protein
MKGKFIIHFHRKRRSLWLTLFLSYGNCVSRPWPRKNGKSAKVTSSFVIRSRAKEKKMMRKRERKENSHSPWVTIAHRNLSFRCLRNVITHYRRHDKSLERAPNATSPRKASKENIKYPATGRWIYHVLLDKLFDLLCFCVGE